jgi:hypothetical protein
MGSRGLENTSVHVVFYASFLQKLPGICFLMNQLLRWRLITYESLVWQGSIVHKTPKISSIRLAKTERVKNERLGKSEPKIADRD